MNAVKYGCAFGPHVPLNSTPGSVLPLPHVARPTDGDACTADVNAANIVLLRSFAQPINYCVAIGRRSCMFFLRQYNHFRGRISRPGRSTV